MTKGKFVHAIARHEYGFIAFANPDEVKQYVNRWQEDLAEDKHEEIATLIEEEKWDEAVALYFQEHPTEYIEYL